MVNNIDVEKSETQRVVNTTFLDTTRIVTGS